MRLLIAGLLLLAAGPARAAAPEEPVLPAAAPTPAPTPTPTATPVPQIDFPGQYAAAPSDWRYPVWPNGCGRFTGDEVTACLRFVTSDFGRLSRYAEANAALGAVPPGTRRVVFFGDSITDNWSKSGYGGFFPGKPYLNRGIGGQTTTQMLLRFRADVIALAPAAVVILAGTNDVGGNSGPMRLETVEDNLASMAELASLHGVRVVLASLLPVRDGKKDRMGHEIVRTHDRPPQTLQALNTWMAEYAGHHGHVYLDYFDALVDAEGAFKSELTDDGLHPNAAGYAVMAPLAERALTAALQER
jgi:lysophospholipase L1-like esterase